jgi:hypothetical protein
VGDQAITRAIDEQVEFFTHNNAQENLFTYHHGRRDHRPSKNFDANRFSHVNFLPATIGIFRRGMPNTKKPETVSDSGW